MDTIPHRESPRELFNAALEDVFKLTYEKNKTQCILCIRRLMLMSMIISAPWLPEHKGPRLGRSDSKSIVEALSKAQELFAGNAEEDMRAAQYIGSKIDVHRSGVFYSERDNNTNAQPLWPPSDYQ